MSVETLFISGPRKSGKTTVARLVAEEVLKRPAHYLRMRAAPDHHTNTVAEVGPTLVPGKWASRHIVTYTAAHAFETLPDALRAVRQRERDAFICIEADADPALRHAFPYDFRIFVMSAPCDVHEVFRDPRAAAVALQQVMQDTAGFASEIFGLFDAVGLDDSVGVEHRLTEGGHDTAEERLDIGEAQIRQFLSSPLGAEIASRIQLQPDYHGLVESDVAIINTGRGGVRDALDECVERLERLLHRVRQDARRHSVLYWGDISDQHDPTRAKLLGRLKALVSL